MGGNAFGPSGSPGYRLSPPLEYNFSAQIPRPSPEFSKLASPQTSYRQITYQTAWGWHDVEQLHQAGRPALTDLCMIGIWASAQAIQQSGLSAGQLAVGMPGIWDCPRHAMH